MVWLASLRWMWASRGFLLFYASSKPYYFSPFYTWCCVVSGGINLFFWPASGYLCAHTLSETLRSRGCWSYYARPAKRHFNWSQIWIHRRMCRNCYFFDWNLSHPFLPKGVAFVPWGFCCLSSVWCYRTHVTAKNLKINVKSSAENDSEQESWMKWVESYQVTTLLSSLVII